MLKDDQKKEAKHKLAAGRILAFRQMPYYTKALMSIETFEREGMGTFGVDKHWRLYYDPIKCLEWSTAEIAAVWLHEVQHLLRDHNGRFENLEGHGHSQKDFNAAADASINSDLRKQGILLPDPERRIYVESKLSPTWVKGMTTEQMYREIYKGGGKNNDDENSANGDSQNSEDKSEGTDDDLSDSQDSNGDESQNEEQTPEDKRQGDFEADDSESSDDDSDSKDDSDSSSEKGSQKDEDSEFDDGNDGSESEGKQNDDPLEEDSGDSSNSGSEDSQNNESSGEENEAGDSDGSSDSNEDGDSDDKGQDSDGESNEDSDGEPSDGDSSQDSSSESSENSDDGEPNGDSDGDSESPSSSEGSESPNSEVNGDQESQENAEGDYGHSSDCGSATGGEARDYEEESDERAITPSAAEYIKKKTAEEIIQYENSNPGSVPGDTVREAERILEPQIDWREEFRAFFRRQISNMRGYQDYTYAKPSRRGGNGSNVIMPSMRAPAPPTMGVILDTSGSMSINHEIAAALGELEELIDRFGRSSNGIPVINCDAGATVTEFVRDLRDFEVVGGGGTDMRVGLKLAASLKPRLDIIIVITDGGTPWLRDIPQDNPNALYVVLLADRNGVKARDRKRIPEWMHILEVIISDSRFIN